MYLSIYLIYGLQYHFQMIVEIDAFSSFMYKNLATYRKHAKFMKISDEEYKYSINWRATKSSVLNHTNNRAFILVKGGGKYL